MSREAHVQFCESGKGQFLSATHLPGMIATVQTFGDLILWHCHVHAIISEGVFMKDGSFVNMPDVDLAKCVARWQKKVFA
jgi:hypothetical protein